MIKAVFFDIDDTLYDTSVLPSWLVRLPCKL
jgi:hypothetical protein